MSGKVSIIVPVYNIQEYLGICIQSLLDQTYGDIEIVLIDDGSTDSSPEIMKKYQSKYANRIKVFHQTNQGVGSARNLGIEKSTGEYITFVDGDDLIKASAIDELVRLFMSDTMIGVVTSRNITFSTQVVFQKTRPGDIKSTSPVISGLDAAKDMMYQKNILNSPHGKMFKRSILGKKLRFPEGYPIGEDLYFNYKVLTSGIKVAVSDEVLYGYRVRLGSAMRSDFKSDRLRLFDLLSEIRVDASGKNTEGLVAAIDNRIFVEAIYTGIQVVGLREHPIANKMCKDVISGLRERVLRDNGSDGAYRLYALLSYLNPSLMLRLVKARVLLGYKLRKILI